MKINHPLIIDIEIKSENFVGTRIIRKLDSELYFYLSYLKNGIGINFMNIRDLEVLIQEDLYEAIDDENDEDNQIDFIEKMEIEKRMLELLNLDDEYLSMKYFRVTVTETGDDLKLMTKEEVITLLVNLYKEFRGNAI